MKENMSDTKDYYKTLQVHPEAGQEIIDAAYRFLSKKYHPDVNRHPQATEHMKELNVAYSIVGDSRKRKLYHQENRIQSFKREQKAVVKDETEAGRVLDEFFKDTINEEWEKAYNRLTRQDACNVPMKDFVDWKNAVTQIYKLGNYSITFFKKYASCEYAGKIYPKILQFSVSVQERHIGTGKSSEDTTQKYVAWDGAEWRVCLGYQDLKQNISKFNHLARSLPKLEKKDVLVKAIDKIDLLTGVFSLQGFVEQAEREYLRSKRYGCPVSMAVISLVSEKEGLKEAEEINLHASLSICTDCLCKNLRRTDLIGRCNDHSLVIIFTETKLSDAKKALVKLIDACEKEGSLDHEIASACVSLTKEDIHKCISSALEKVAGRRHGEGMTGPSDQRKVKLKLGKYQAADILGFNKKGRNHF